MVEGGGEVFGGPGVRLGVCREVRDRVSVAELVAVVVIREVDRAIARADAELCVICQGQSM